ncbi:MAG: hypothetical protein ACYTXA_16340 [Nostoc sp.]
MSQLLGKELQKLLHAFLLSLPAIADFDSSKKDNHQGSLICGG